MFTLQHRHTFQLDPKLSGQFDRFLDLWERSLIPEGMTPEEESAFVRQNNKEAEALEQAVQAAQK